MSHDHHHSHDHDHSHDHAHEDQIVGAVVTELPESRVSIACEVSPSAFHHAIEHAASDLGRQVKVPGFRKGKVPTKVLISRFGREVVIDEAIRSHLGGWYAEAVAEAGVEPVGDPKIELGDIPEQDDGTLGFTVEVGVPPKAKLGDYLGIKVEREDATVDDDRIDAEVERLREQVARLESSDAAAGEGDTLVMSYAGSIEGEAFDGGTASDQTIELGSGRFIPGFEEGLTGVKAGETRKIDVTFPDDYPAEHLAGREAVFEIEVSEVRVKRLPELDDSFAAEVGYDTLDELRADVRERMTEAEDRRVRSDFREACIDAVVDKAKIDVPDHLIEGRAAEMWERTLRALAGQGIGREAYLQIAGKSEEEIIAEARPDADRSLRRDAVIEAIVAKEGIVPSESDLEDALEQSAEQEGVPAAELLARLRAAGRDAQLVRELSNRMAVDLVEERAKPVAAKSS